jgi:outer membrane protein assembly factor BamB
MRLKRILSGQRLRGWSVVLVSERHLKQNGAMKRRWFLPLLLFAAIASSLQAQAPRDVVAPVTRNETTRVVPRLSTAYDWLQFNFDSAHSGNNTLETTLQRGNAASLARLFAVSLPEVADGAPAVASGVPTSTGPRDLLFVTTKAGRLVAMDARTGAILWSQQPATGPRFTTSSPAIDPNRQFVYSYGLEGRVHKYLISDGTEITDGGWPEITTLKPDVEKESPALSIAQAKDGRTFLYVANGGYPGDEGDYQGHITAIDLSTGSQQVFNAICSDSTFHFAEHPAGADDCLTVQSAIWARSGVVYDEATDRIFMSTGNGTFDGNAGGHNWGDSVFSLHPDGSGAGGSPLDSYTPANYQMLDSNDLDLGSCGPAIFPAPPGGHYQMLAVQGGKDQQLRLLRRDNLSQQGGPGHTGGEIQILPVPQGGEVLAAIAVWTNPVNGLEWIFIATASGLSGLTVELNSSGNPFLKHRWLTEQGGFSPIVANGVLYYAGSGRIRALDPTSGSVLWGDTRIGPIHWESPVVANGILYITDENGMLSAYSLGGSLPPS